MHEAEKKIYECTQLAIVEEKAHIYQGLEENFQHEILVKETALAFALVHHLINLVSNFFDICVFVSKRLRARFLSSFSFVHIKDIMLLIIFPQLSNHTMLFLNCIFSPSRTVRRLAKSHFLVTLLNLAFSLYM